MMKTMIKILLTMNDDGDHNYDNSCCEDMDALVDGW